MSTEITAPQSTPAEAPASTPAPAAPAVTESTPAESSSPASQSATPAYVPNYKFKVRDKEVEVDEFLRGSIKDEKSQKRVQELYEKAYGLDYVKPQFDQTTEQLNQLIGGFQGLQETLAQGKLEDFMGFWKIPDDKLFQYAVKRLQHLELPPEQRVEIERQQQVEMRATQAEQQMQALKEQVSRQVGQMRLQQLEMAVSRADVAEAAAEFDSRVGKPGAFRDEVIKRGQIAWHTQRKDLPVGEAVREVMNLLGYDESDEDGTPQAKVVAPAAQKKLPTLPNLGAGGPSPVKKAITSLADIKAAAKRATA
jgi:hypothetical protein